MTVRSKPTWSDVKAKLAGFDRPGLIGLVQDLCVASKTDRRSLTSWTPATRRCCECGINASAGIGQWATESRNEEKLPQPFI